MQDSRHLIDWVTELHHHPQWMKDIRLLSWRRVALTSMSLRRDEDRIFDGSNNRIHVTMI
jgi:hypothetical protein